MKAIEKIRTQPKRIAEMTIKIVRTTLDTDDDDDCRSIMYDDEDEMVDALLGDGAVSDVQDKQYVDHFTEHVFLPIHASVDDVSKWVTRYKWVYQGQLLHYMDCYGISSTADLIEVKYHEL